MSDAVRADHEAAALRGPGGGAPGTADAAASGTAIGALLVGAVLLRIGATGGTLAVQFDLTHLMHGRPNPAVVGAVGVSQALTEAVLAPVLARWADRLGRRRFLVGGPLCGAIGIALVALAAHPSQIIAVRVLEGVGAAAFVPTALGVIAAATSGSRGTRAKASSAFEASTLGGYAGGAIAGGLLWHALHAEAFLALAGLYVAASLVCLVFAPRTGPLHVSPLRTVVRVITGRGPIRTFIPAWLAVNTLVGAWYFHIGSLLHRRPVTGQTLVHGFDERLIGLFFVVWVGLLVLGIIMWTPTLQRIGPVATMVRAVPGAFLVLAGLCAMNHLPLHAAPALLPVVMVGALIMAGFAPAAVAFLADCSEVLSSDRSAFMAFYTITLAGGGALGSFLGGYMLRWLLADGLIVLGAILAVIAMLSVVDTARLTRSGPAGSTPITG